MKDFKSKEGKILFSYTKEMDKTFRFHLERLTNSINEEDVHYLRRAMKKLKALYNLLEQIDPGFTYKKRFSPIKPIFNSAGLLRELQMNQKALSGYNVSTTFITCYEDHIKTEKKKHKKDLEKAIKKFKNRAHKKSLSKIEKICSRVSTDKIQNSIACFLEKNIDQVKIFMIRDITESELHSVRLLFKKMSPSLIIIDLVKKNSIDKTRIEKYKKVEDKLGYWHDRVMLYQSLKTMQFTGNYDPEFSKELQSTLLKVEKEKSICFNNAIQLASNTLNIPIENFISVSDNP
jgi:CHAD domain-containing protein